MVEMIDWFEEAWFEKGASAPLECALDELANSEGKDLETVRRYYRLGVRRLAEDEARVAKEAGRIIATGGLNAGLRWIAERQHCSLWVAQRRYDRGMRALNRIADK